MWFYEWQINTIENLPDIKSEFWELIDDYLDETNKTEESNIFLDWILLKSKNLSKVQFHTLVSYVNEKREQASWDNKMQLLNLWAWLYNTKEKAKIEKNEEIDNIDFEITGWSITVKTLKIFHKKGLKFWSDTKNVEYDIVDEKILKIWADKYKILLKRENSDRIHEFIIKYKWWNSITIFDEYWRYIWRQQIKTKEKLIVEWHKYRKKIYKTPWKITIDTKGLKIKLNLVFNKQKQ
jgi:hypothetical protein